MIPYPTVIQQLELQKTQFRENEIIEYGVAGIPVWFVSGDV